MPRPSGVALAATGVAAIVVAGLVTGGVMVARLVDPPSPTTTVVDDDGQEVELDWADYPADSYQDPADVLAAPRAEEVQAVGEAELAALEASTGPVAPELEWAFEQQDGVTFEAMPTGGGNGYGGPTLHWIYNSPSNLGEGLDEDADWDAIVAAVDAEVVALGYDPIEWEFDREPYDHETEAERDDAIVQVHGSLERDEMWMWSGTATRGSMWVWVSIWDARRDTTPEEPWQDAESGVSLFVGGTIVSEDDEQAYADGVAPFEGLARPQSTHSD